MSLVLHCGARAVEPAQIAACPTPRPTRTWTPIPHLSLLEQTTAVLTQGGLEIVEQAHALSTDGSRYFGLLRLGGDNGDYGMVVGLRNSHDQTFPAALCCGHQVFVCDNLSFSAEIVLTRRHTRYILRDLPEMICRAVAQLAQLRVAQDERIAHYRQVQLTPMGAHDLFVRAVDARVLPVTALPQAVEEWRRPSYPEFETDGWSAWRWLNSVTEVLKGRSLDALPRRTQALHGLLDSACGLKLAGSA